MTPDCSDELTVVIHDESIISTGTIDGVPFVRIAHDLDDGDTLLVFPDARPVGTLRDLARSLRRLADRI